MLGEPPTGSVKSSGWPTATTTSALVAWLCDHYTSLPPAVPESAPMIELLASSLADPALHLHHHCRRGDELADRLQRRQSLQPVRALDLAGADGVTEPVLRPIRRRMPDLGGIDISPVVLIISAGSCRASSSPTWPSSSCETRHAAGPGASMLTD